MGFHEMVYFQVLCIGLSGRETPSCFTSDTKYGVRELGFGFWKAGLQIIAAAVSAWLTTMRNNPRMRYLLLFMMSSF